MFKSVKEFEAAMHEILIKIRDEEDYQSLSSKLGQEDFDDALERCINQGLIKGIQCNRVASGRLLCDIVHKPRIAYEGLQFVESFKN